VPENWWRQIVSEMFWIRTGIGHIHQVIKKEVNHAKAQTWQNNLEVSAIGLGYMSMSFLQSTEAFGLRFGERESKAETE
jgi:hypothetical protein